MHTPNERTVIVISEGWPYLDSLDTAVLQPVPDRLDVIGTKPSPTVIELSELDQNPPAHKHPEPQYNAKGKAKHRPWAGR